MRRLLIWFVALGSDLRVRLLFLSVLICAPLFILVFYGAAEERRHVRNSFSQCAEKIAQVAAREEQAIVAQSRELLHTLAESQPVRSASPEQCQRMVNQLAATLLRFTNVGVIGVNGRLLASAAPVYGTVLRRSPEPRTDSTSTSIARSFAQPRRLVLLSPHDEPGRLRGYVRPETIRSVSAENDIQRRLSQDDRDDNNSPVYALDAQADSRCLPLLHLLEQTLQNRSFTAGDLFFDPDTLRPTINFGYPVRDRFGQIQAIAFAALNWPQPSRPELRAWLPKGASWTEVDSDGKILARFPDKKSRGQHTGLGKAEIGKAMLSANAEKHLVNAMDSGGLASVCSACPRASVFAIRPVFGVVAVPKRVLFAEVDRSLARNLTWLTITVALTLGIGWLSSKRLLLRPLQALANSAARLAAGDFKARTGFASRYGELGRLAECFDRMAANLEERELERRKVSHQLQSLSQNVLQIQESERRHIARELHDEIGQSLTVAEMNLQAALRFARKPALARRLQESVEAVERVLEQVQDLSLNLRPSMLDDLGLEPTLRWYINRQASLAGFQAEFTVDPMENRPEPLLETECFRIAQEALTNVIRHARARVVRVELTQNDGQLHLRVRDDGIGFNVDPVREAARGVSLGLINMQERAALAGGGLQLDSAPGEGTTIHAWFPLKWRAETI